MRTGTLSCTTGSRRTEVSRWALTSISSLFFFFRPFPRSVPLELRLKGKLRATVKVKFEDGPLTLLCFSVFQTVFKTCKTQLKAAIPYFLYNIFCAIHQISCISAYVKGCHSIFSLQHFFVLFTKSVASVLMLKRLRWIGPFPKLSHRGLHYLNMPSFPNWQPNNLYNNFFKFRFFFGGA